MGQIYGHKKQVRKWHGWVKPAKYNVGKSWFNTTQKGTSRMKRLLANKKKVA
tara:strand:+ start:124 stop:279 length:156 start_codon:yes stop_codon:yes gene_type:complete